MSACKNGNVRVLTLPFLRLDHLRYFCLYLSSISILILPFPRVVAIKMPAKTTSRIIAPQHMLNSFIVICLFTYLISLPVAVDQQKNYARHLRSNQFCSEKVRGDIDHHSNFLILFVRHGFCLSGEFCTDPGAGKIGVRVKV